MPLTRIRQTAIGNDSITTAKLDDTSGGLTLPGVEYVKVPVGTTAQRPSSPVNGYMRYNTDFERLEQYANGQWQAIDTPPSITSLSYPGSVTAADPAGGETITLSGTNFQSGATVTVGGTSATSVSVVSSTSITFTTPVKTAGDYDVVVTNSNGLAATLTNGISYNGTPAFTTAAGNLGSIAEDIAMSTITIVAAEPDGGTLAYSVTSGALPTGVSLGSANGQLTGTPNTNVTSDTTFNFTVTATDDETQTNSRAFNLIVLRPIYATQISNSLRFNNDDSSYLTRTPSSAGNRKTFTYSVWVKRSTLGSSPASLFTAGTNSSSPRTVFRFTSSNTIEIGFNPTINTWNYSYPSAVFRDVSGWMHLVMAVDMTQSTSTDRLKFYVNGEAQTFSSYSMPAQNTDLTINSTVNHTIGSYSGGSNSSAYFDGYMSDIHFIDGQALTPTSFAEEFNGVWAPKAYSGSYGTNGFHLEFGDSSAIGDDTSGNTNDWTPNNFGTFDVFPDSPTINFCTLNPLIKRRDVTNNVTFYQGNLGAVYPNASGNQTYSLGTHGMSSGKWYYEVYMFTTGSNTTVGIGGQNDWDASGQDSVIYKNDGVVTTYLGGSKDGDGASFANGDIVGCGFDLDNGIVTFYKNGTLQSTVTGISTTTHLPYVRGTTSEQILTNFGQDSTFSGTVSAASNADGNGIGNFKYTVPSGHLAICSKNLSESTISTVFDDRPEDYFNTVLYNGTGSAQSITGVGFQPDWVWVKKRNTTARNHVLTDSNRGATKGLFSSLTDGEVTNAQGLTSFDSDGFSVGTYNNFNETSGTYVAWNWKAGGAPTATNSAGAGNVPTSGSVMIDGVASTSALAGTIAANKISANTKSGFSIVQYTGTSADGSVAHGLGVKPAFIIVKRTSNAGGWPCWHKGLTGGNEEDRYVYLNSTDAAGTTTDYWGTTGITSTTFGLWSSGGDNNNSGDNLIAYCFAEVEGFSKFDNYVGNNSTDGPFIETGFKPAFVLIKANGAGTSWVIYDNKRDTYNPVTKNLFANQNAAEATSYSIDFLSNGFKIRSLTSNLNDSGITMIYSAFAEDPFKYAEAR